MTQSIAMFYEALPLAQRDAWESLGSRFSGEHAKFSANDLLAMGGVLVAGITLVLLLRWLYGLQQARRLSNEPRHLFVDVCRAHRLRRGDCTLLASLADFHGLTTEASLFVRPELFAIENLPEVDDQTIADYERLHDRIFAGLELAKAKPILPQSGSTQPASAVVPVSVPFESSSIPADTSSNF